MRWKGRRQSDNVEDRRGSAGGVIAGGGIGTLLLVLVVYLMGGDPSQLIQNAPSAGPGQTRERTPEEQEQFEFVGVVLADTEEVWTDLFRTQLNREYKLPKLVVFSGQIQSACGFADSAVGPFYCPSDSNVYIDLSFFQMLDQRFGAPGEFARAYVVAHEVGHHVQNQLGLTDRVHNAKGRVSEREYNDLSVRLELQADFLAGVWAHHAQRTKNILDRKDIEDAIRAANAIGDDTLQRQGQGYVVPDSFTHGTSEQRVRWFLKGWESGRISDGDTFNAKSL